MIDQLTSTIWGQVVTGIVFFTIMALGWVYGFQRARSWLNQGLAGDPWEGLRPLFDRYLPLLRIWGLLAIGLFAAELLGTLGPPWSHLLSKGLFGALVALVGVSITQGVVYLIGNSLSAVQTPRSLIRFAQMVALTTLSYLILLLLLAIVDISFTPLLGFGIVAAVPLVLVLQRGASDLFFYFRLMRRQHLRVGDFVRLETGITGHVESISWQDVRIRSRANHLVVIPNRRMNKLVVTNFHLPDKRALLTVPILVTHGPSPEAIEGVISEEFHQAANELVGLAPDLPPEIKEVAGEAVEGRLFVVACWVEQEELAAAVERELVKRFARRFKAEGIGSHLADPPTDLLRTQTTSSMQDLRYLVQNKLQDLKFVVASNAEPFRHTFEGQSIRWEQPASGLVTALDPVMRVLGGTWIAVARGNADREVSDPQGRISVPPDQPSYTLRRLWLTKEQEERYYYGISNRALWPLCHAVYVRPEFRADEWKAYEEVNYLFTDAILEEVRGKRAFVFLQDFHLALVPRLLKEAGADVTVTHFWHIPWPTAEVFQTCPWAERLLDGLLGNDLLGFHTRYDCNNFLDTVDRLVESRVDYGQYRVDRGGHQTLVRPFPISVDFEAISQSAVSASVQREMAVLRRDLGIPQGLIGLGVERLDYTKGIPERLQAIDRFLDRHPRYKGRFTFIQVAVPSRSQIREYQSVDAQVQQLVQEINWRHQLGSWQPILYLRRYFSRIPLLALYSMADLCIVSSLHDGMNMVAKEYLAARTEGRGVLLLSKFTGAAAELRDALLINPYDIDQFAEAIVQGLEMPAQEQVRRMQRMRAQIQENDIYRWALRFLRELAQYETPAVESLFQLGESGPNQRWQRQ